MYEEKSSIDWKGLFLKVVIVCLLVLIAVKGYTILKGNKKDTSLNDETKITESKKSSTFTENMEELKLAGNKYFNEHSDKLPTVEGSTTMVSLNELIEAGYITNLSDEDGKVCDADSSYVTATLTNGKITQKTNLVCNNAASYTIVNMDKNDDVVTNTTNYGGATVTNSTSKSVNNNQGSTKSCSSSTCAPSVSVNVKQTISTSSKNKDTSTTNKNNSVSYSSNTKYYTVKFDRNGGNINYASSRVKAYDRVVYPGDNEKNYCDFDGWYYNGSKYNFNSSVTSDMTLVAHYTCYSDSYYDNYYDNNNYNNYNNYYNKQPLQYETTVHSMGWAAKGTNNMKVTHTLRLPSYFREANTKEIRIKSIRFYDSLISSGNLVVYYNNHPNTFIFNKNGYEAYNLKPENVSTIKSNSVYFINNAQDFKSYRDAYNNGFNVGWVADSVYSQCRTGFSLLDPATGKYINNLCGYGIIYKVTWEYILY